MVGAIGHPLSGFVELQGKPRIRVVAERAGERHDAVAELAGPERSPASCQWVAADGEARGRLPQRHGHAAVAAAREAIALCSILVHRLPKRRSVGSGRRCGSCPRRANGAE